MGVSSILLCWGQSTGILKGAEHGPTRDRPAYQVPHFKPQILGSFLPVLHNNPFQSSIISLK